MSDFVIGSLASVASAMVGGAIAWFSQVGLAKRNRRDAVWDKRAEFYGGLIAALLLMPYQPAFDVTAGGYIRFAVALEQWVRDVKIALGPVYALADKSTRHKIQEPIQAILDKAVLVQHDINNIEENLPDPGETHSRQQMVNITASANSSRALANAIATEQSKIINYLQASLEIEAQS